MNSEKKKNSWLTLRHVFYGEISQNKKGMSCLDSRFDLIGGSELVSGCETIYLGLFTYFFRGELIPVGIQTIFVITKNHLHIQRNYHRSGIH